MEEYITSITLEINGEQEDNFTAFEEDERELKRLVKLMNKTGTTKVKGPVKFNLDYVVPKNSPERNFEEIEDGTVTVDYENGKRISFGGVECLKIGKARYDGEKEVVKTIEFAATERTEE